MELNANEVVRVLQYTMSVCDSIHVDGIEDMKKIVNVYQANSDLLQKIIDASKQAEENVEEG